MKKVGIMSMQRIANYGSFLQAYALKQLIEELGCEVQFVDYHVGAQVIAENADSSNKLVRKLKKGLETFQYKAPLSHKVSFIRYKQSFASKYMPLLGITDEMNYNPTLDCLVIGSDEVFNCIQKNSNVGYSLELFGKDNYAKRLITYAASFGNTTLDKLEKYGKVEEVGNLLKKFDAISVRDANSGSIIEQLTDKQPVYNLDPVLTYDYMKCNRIPQIRADEKYLILYAYAGRISNEEADWISAYAKKKGLKVYAIGGIQKCADRFIDCSPFEVLAYFIFSYHPNKVMHILAYYIAFVVLEFGIYFFLMGKAAWKYEFYWITLVELIVFPLYVIRDYNFIMRGSIPALFMLMYYIVKFFLEKTRGILDGARMVLIIVLCIGAITPLCEINRSIYKTVSTDDFLQEDVYSFADIKTNEDEHISTIKSQFFIYDFEDTLFFKYLAK